jgi:hypothetical protein
MLESHPFAFTPVQVRDRKDGWKPSRWSTMRPRPGQLSAPFVEAGSRWQSGALQEVQPVSYGAAPSGARTRADSDIGEMT